MRRRLVPLLLLLTACESSGPAKVGVVVSNYPGTAGALAIEDHTSAGGVAMDALTPTTPTPIAAGVALEIAERLGNDPALIAVIGHSNSAASLAASQVYNRVGLVQLAPTTTATVYDDAGPYSFRMVPGDDRQAEFVAAAVRTGWSDAERIAAVYVNDDYGRSFYRELRPRLTSLVFEGVYGEMSDTTHLIQLVDGIVQAQPDVLIWVGRPLRLRVVLQPLLAALPELRTLCGDACDDADVYANAHGEYTGLRFVRFFDPHAPGAELESLQRRYGEATGTVATGEALLTYDAVRLIGEALNNGAQTRDQVRDYLESLGRTRAAYEGVTGPVMFDPAGSVMRDYELAEITTAGVRPVTVPGR